MPKDLTVQGLTPMGRLLEMVLMQPDSLEKAATTEAIRSLATLMREERDYQTRVEFDSALSRVQKEVTKIARDMTGDKGTKYASFEALDGALRPHYTGEDFALSFDAEPNPPDGYQVVIAYLSRMGHTRTYHLPLKIDRLGPKGNPVMNETQASVSAMSYGCRTLLRRIFNVGQGEDDHDGISPEQGEMLDSFIKQIETGQDYRDAYGKAFALARETGNAAATVKVIDAFEKRKKAEAK